MTGSPYVGRAPDSDAIVVPKGYADDALAAVAVTTNSVNAQVATTAATLTTRIYVDQQNSQLALKTDVLAADALYVPTSALGTTVASLDASGNLVASQLPTGVRTDRVAQFYSMPQPSPPPKFDAVGGASGLGGSPSWNHGPSVDGAYALVGIFTDRPPGTSAATFAGKAMTSLSTVVSSGSQGATYLQWYGLPNAPGGTSPVAINTTGQAWWEAVSLTYLNVTSVSDPANLAPTTGSGYQIRSVTLANNQFAVMAFGIATVGNAIGISGGTTRFNQVNTGAGLAVADVFTQGNTDFTAGSSGTPRWSSSGLIFTGLAPTGGVGTLLFSSPLTLVNNAQPGTKLATIPVPDLGFPYRVLPHAWVKADSGANGLPPSAQQGNGHYGLLTVRSSSNNQIHGIGVCTGSVTPTNYPVLPYAAVNQTPTTVAPLTGANSFDLYASMWSGAKFTYYPDELVYHLICFPAL